MATTKKRKPARRATPALRRLEIEFRRPRARKREVQTIEAGPKYRIPDVGEFWFHDGRRYVISERERVDVGHFRLKLDLAKDQT